MDAIESLVDAYKDVLGPFAVIPVGEGNYALLGGRTKMIEGGDWVLADFDDVLAATTAAKAEQKKAFGAFLASHGVPIEDDAVARLVASTDAFARWPERPGGAPLYHLAAQKAALEWVAEEIVRRNASSPRPHEDLVRDLFLMKEKNAMPLTDGTFAGDTRVIFEKTTLAPKPYEAILDALRAPAHPMNVGLLTYGEPSFQLEKAFRLLKDQALAGKPLPVTNILLAAEYKADFMAMMIAAPGLPAIGHPFDASPHAVVLIDDYPDVFRAVEATRAVIEAKTGARIGFLRTIRKDTKYEFIEWQAPMEASEVDLRQEDNAGRLKDHIEAVRQSVVSAIKE